MKKNILYSIYSAAFIGMCLAPAALMPIVKSDSAKEKRKLADKPKIKTEDGKLNFSYFDEFEAFFSDHFAFRQELVNTDGRLKAALFGTSPNENVIVGKDGWLYYGETADDFLNINTLSERAVSNIKNNLDMVNTFCTENNADFVFTSAPNKNSVYPEYMPFNYIESDNLGNYELLDEALQSESYWCNMKDVLNSADASIPLYHKTDTHWNNMGAYVGHVGLMTKLGREACPAGSKWSTKNDRLGDLAAMIYPAEKAKDTQVYTDYEFKYCFSGRVHGLDDINIKTSCENGEGNLLMFRDSYGEAILQYMAECFETAEFSRSVPYNISNVDGGAVIIEIVERNLGDLQKYAPVMPAPVSELPQADAVYVGSGAELESVQSGNFEHFYGVLPDEMFADESADIFVTADGVTYKAFNCFEDKLLGREGEVSDNGFSLYIPSENLTEKKVSVTVVSGNGRTIKVDF